MKKILRFLVLFIAYFCVASVIAASVGLAYLWQSGSLTDEKVFQMVALVHDVDVEQLEKELREAERAVPPEEVSLEEIDRHRSLQLRNHELKNAEIERNLQEFEHRLNQIQELTRRFDSQARSFQDLLAEEENSAIEQGNAEVVSQWEQLTPTQVKDLIMTMIEREEITDVVRLLKRIDEIKKRKILTQFSTEVEEEKEALYDIQALLRDGFPKKDVINAARQQGNLSEPRPQG
jgi:hypothetical protein